MSNAHKIILVDDHKLYREGISFVISQMDGFEVVGEAESGKAFLEMIDSHDPDIILMDMFLPDIDGITACLKALDNHPDLKIIAMAMFCEEEYYYDMIKAGVSGYILKDSGKDEIERSLIKVVSGETYFSGNFISNTIQNNH